MMRNISAGGKFEQFLKARNMSNSHSLPNKYHNDKMPPKKLLATFAIPSTKIKLKTKLSKVACYLMLIINLPRVLNYQETTKPRPAGDAKSWESSQLLVN